MRAFRVTTHATCVSGKPVDALPEPPLCAVAGDELGSDCGMQNDMFCKSAAICRRRRGAAATHSSLGLRYLLDKISMTASVRQTSAAHSTAKAPVNQRARDLFPAVRLSSSWTKDL